MKSKAKPYIGITGFKTLEEVQAISKIFDNYEFNENSEYLPMFGFICSHKRLENLNSEGKKSPSVNSLNKLIAATPEYSIPMIHFWEKPGKNCEKSGAEG